MIRFIYTSHTITCNHNQLQQLTISDGLRLAPFCLDCDCLPFYSLFFCEWLLTYGWIRLKSKSHCDWRSVSKSWCRAPSGAHDQIFINVWQLLYYFCGASSLTRGRVCPMYMLLSLASAVFLRSESLRTRDHILLSQIWDFLFVASYDSQGHGGGIRPRLHTGFSDEFVLIWTAAYIV
jgi:hypothetical protein